MTCVGNSLHYVGDLNPACTQSLPVRPSEKDQEPVESSKDAWGAQVWFKVYDVAGNIGAKIITYSILGVPFFYYNISGPQTLL